VESVVGRVALGYVLSKNFTLAALLTHLSLEAAMIDPY